MILFLWWTCRRKENAKESQSSVRWPFICLSSQEIINEWPKSHSTNSPNLFLILCVFQAFQLTYSLLNKLFNPYEYNQIRFYVQENVTTKTNVVVRWQCSHWVHIILFIFLKLYSFLLFILWGVYFVLRCITWKYI